jgi:GT2 family glycosyltransferase
VPSDGLLDRDLGRWYPRGVVDKKPVSVVIPTYNRRQRLTRMLGALDKQSVSPDTFEAVVVDDGSSDGTAEFIKGQRYRFALRVISQPNGGPAKARNTGVEAATGTLLLFLDDDVEPTEGLVGEHLRCHESEKDVVVMGPLASLPHYRQPWVAWEQAKLEAQYEAMVRGDWQPTFRQFWTGNASVAREHVVAVGGFNDAFLRAEDVELGFRLHERGLKFRFNPAARGLHHVERSLEGWMNAHRSYGRLEPSIFAKDGAFEIEKVLGDNWSTLHPATRWLVRRCIDSSPRQKAASFVLCSLLKLEEKTQAPILASQMCGALANILYWRACREEIGMDRAHRIMRRGDDIRRANVT